MSTTTKIGMPLDDFITASNSQAFELINGEKREKLPSIAGHNYVMHLVYQMLFRFLMQNSLGEAFIEATFILPDADDSNWVRGSRIPDVCFFLQARLDAYRQANPDWRKKPYALVPDLVVEIVSPNDKVIELDEKIDAYLADGVRLIWVINPQREKAIVYAPDQDQPYHLTRDGVLEGREILPDFTLNLTDLFKTENDT